MKTLARIGIKDIQEVYSGAEGDLWKLIMGEQIHIGGMTSSMDLADRARIGRGQKGIDLCCCIGAGMRFLVLLRNVDAMTGVDITPSVVERGRKICEAEGLSEKITFTVADVCNNGLPGESADFIWGEDAWCYVEDKKKLIAEAARLVRKGGTIAFTDWVEGPAGLTTEEYERFMAFMKFPSFESLEGYNNLLSENGCRVLQAMDTGRFAPHMDLYINMLTMQLTFDALKIISFNVEMMQALAAEMAFAQDLARRGKIIQGLFVAIKK